MNYGDLTPEEIERLRAAQKKRLVWALIGGLILAVAGFFAGRALAEHRAESGAPSAEPTAVVDLHSGGVS